MPYRRSRPERVQSATLRYRRLARHLIESPRESTVWRNARTLSAMNPLGVNTESVVLIYLIKKINVIIIFVNNGLSVFFNP